jgi:hypothetical protein
MTALDPQFLCGMGHIPGIFAQHEFNEDAFYLFPEFVQPVKI